MRIAAIRSQNGKIFGTVNSNSGSGSGSGGIFRPLLSGGKEVHDLREIIALLRAGKLDLGAPVGLDTVKLAAPVGPLAKNVISVGKNYHDHAQEFARSGFDQSGDKIEVPEAPVVFTKAVTALADPGQGLPASSDSSNSTDYEGELGVVIGRRVKNVKNAEDAYAAVFGYTIVNDATARMVQQKHKQWFLGKSLDGYCPVGPVLVTADEFGRPDAQELITTVNGERRQYARLRDLIATGTPAGVGIGFKPPKFLKKGDAVAMEVDGIGRLINQVG